MSYNQLMIKAITFDLDGVYFLNGKVNFINNLVKFGVPEEEAVRVFLKSDQMNQSYKTGKMTDQEFWSWAISEWKIDLTTKEITGLLIKGYEINDEAVNLLRKIRKNGYKTLICSNNFSSRINGLQKKFHFLNDFDLAIFSYQAGETKPSKKIFQELVNRSGLKAEEIVFADDNQANLAGAKEVGIKAFFYQGFLPFVDQLKKLGIKTD